MCDRPIGFLPRPGWAMRRRKYLPVENGSIIIIIFRVIAHRALINGIRPVARCGVNLMNLFVYTLTANLRSARGNRIGKIDSFPRIEFAMQLAGTKYLRDDELFINISHGIIYNGFEAEISRNWRNKSARLMIVCVLCAQWNRILRALCVKSGQPPGEGSPQKWSQHHGWKKYYNLFLIWYIIMLIL